MTQKIDITLNCSGDEILEYIYIKVLKLENSKSIQFSTLKIQAILASERTFFDISFMSYRGYQNSEKRTEIKKFLLISDMFNTMSKTKL